MGLIVPVFLLIAWQLAANIGWIETVWFPAPITIAQTFYELAASGELFEHIGITSMRVLAGFIIGASVGTIAGSITGYSKTAKQLLDPMLQALRNIPGLAWSPLFLLWFGIFEESKILLIATGVSFPVYLTLSSGIAQVDRNLIEVGMVFEFDAKTQITKIILPASLPIWITALRNGMSLGWIFVVAAELMGASRGVGFLMYDAQQVSRADIIIVSIILFACLGKICDWILELIGKKLLKYQNIE